MILSLFYNKTKYMWHFTSFFCTAHRLPPIPWAAWDVIKWKYFPSYWPFVWGIYRSPVNSPHRGQWRGALMFSLICAWMNDWANNRMTGELRRHRGHYDVTVMVWKDITNHGITLMDPTPMFAAKVNAIVFQWHLKQYRLDCIARERQDVKY